MEALRFYESAPLLWMRTVAMEAISNQKSNRTHFKREQYNHFEINKMIDLFGK